MAALMPIAVNINNSSDTVVHGRHLQAYFPAPSITAAHNSIEDFLSANLIEPPTWKSCTGPYVPMSNCDEHIDSKIEEIHRLRICIRTAGIDAQTNDNSIPTFVEECFRNARSARQFTRSQWWRDVKRLPLRREMDISAAKALQPNPIVRWWKNTDKDLEQKAILRAKKTDEVRDKRLSLIRNALDMLDKQRVMIMIGESEFVWNPNCCEYNGVMQGQQTHGTMHSRQLEKIDHGAYSLRIGYTAYAGATWVPGKIEVHRAHGAHYKRPNIIWIPRKGDHSRESYINVQIVFTDEDLAVEQYRRDWNENWATENTPSPEERRREEYATAEVRRLDKLIKRRKEQIIKTFRREYRRGF